MGQMSKMEKDNTFKGMLKTARSAFDSGTSLPISFRIDQLKKILQIFTECEDEILEALHTDLRKSPYEARMGDFKTVQAEVNGMLRHIKEYTANDVLPLNVIVSTDKGYVRKEPYGVVLILGTWNYPFQSTFQPLVGAIASGNCAVVKPSEVTPTCAQLMATIIPRYLDSNCYHVVTGDVDSTKSLLTNKFDYIFCTGSPTVGRSVLQAAAPNLTPVTLELGGKSPCYIDPTANLSRAAKRILWGKLINDGQICVCPDYIICPKVAEKEFVRVAKELIKEWYCEDLQKSPDLIRIVNNRHFNRLKKLLDTTKGEIVIGGKTDEADLWIEPTIVVDVDPVNDSLMQEEIFGPILPIVSVENIDEAIKLIRSRSKPLAMYVFSDNENAKKLIEATSSGSVCVNDVFWQATWIGLPFGGVGESGMGSYHGKYSFETFSHKRAILERKIDYLSEKFGEARYPPYSPAKFRFFSFIINYFETFNIPFGGTLTHSVALLFGGLIAIFILALF